MAGDGWAAVGAGFTQLSNLFANKLISNMEEKRAIAHAEALRKIEIAEEDRQLGKQKMEPVERKLYQAPSEDGRPPLLMVDKLNKFGETIEQELPTPREIQEYEARTKAEAEAKRLADEDRAFKERPEFKDGFWVDRKAGTAVPEQGYLEQQVRERAAGRTNVTVNSDGTPPTGFEKALDKKDADYYDSLRAAATTAANTKQRLDVIKTISQTAETGKIPEALAIAGQYLGTDAGKDLQTFNAAAQPLFLDMAEQMKGALSDKDREALQQAIPRFGNDPRANKVVIDLLETAANRAQSTFADADKYAQENRSLRGYTPASSKAVKPPEQKPVDATMKVAVNPETGERLVLRNGKWVPE